MLICLDTTWRSYIPNGRMWDAHQESHEWLMTSRERLWHGGADVVFARLGGLEWASHFTMVHVACPHVYFVDCQGFVAREANAASKQKVEVALQRFVIIHHSITRLGRPRWPPGLSHMASWTTSRRSYSTLRHNHADIDILVEPPRRGGSDSSHDKQ
jgi:hypothetical protein